MQHYNQVNQVHRNFSQTTDAKKLCNKLTHNDPESKTPSWAIGHHKRCEKRAKALEKINAGYVAWSTKKYVVPESLQLLENDFGLPICSLEEFYENQFQHVLHDEFIDILNKSEPIYTSKNTHVFDKELTQVVVHFAGVGVEHNTNGYSHTAMNISDFCNSVLDHINAFDSRLFGENNTVVKYIDAFERGLQDGIRKKISDISNDPLGYCKNIAVGIMVMAGHLIKIFQEASTQLILTRHYPEIARLKLLDDAQQVAHFTQIVSKYCKDHAGLQIAQHGGALVADVVLDAFLAGKIFNAFGKLSKIAMAQRGNAASFFKRMNPQNSVVVQTADGHRFLLSAEEALQVLGDERTCSSAGNIVELTSQTLIENTCSTKLASGTGKSTNPTAVLPGSKNPITLATNGVVNNSIFSNLKSIGQNIWESPGGIIYGNDNKFGNNLYHILDHAAPNPAKQVHTVFSISKDNIIPLIDEAWTLKGNPLISDPVVYIVDMKRVIGTQGETALRMVVKKIGTAELKTAYPVNP